jgi:hypothetical protein
MSAKQTKITIETREVWIVRRPGKVERAWCVSCAAWVEMVTPEEAAHLTNSGVRVIFRWIEQARLHFSETPAGNVMLCLPSLLAGRPGENGSNPLELSAGQAEQP